MTRPSRKRSMAREVAVSVGGCLGNQFRDAPDQEGIEWSATRHLRRDALTATADRKTPNTRQIRWVKT